MKREALKGMVLGLLLVMVGIGLGTTWNAAFEAVPAGTDLASDLDTFINVFKAEVRKRVAVEHIFGNATDDSGLHNMGSSRVFAQNAAPTDIAGPGQFNSTADAYAGTLLSTTEVGASGRDLGAGRIWIDLDGTDTGATSTLDDKQAFLWDETANAFQAVTARDVGGAGIGARNLLYNGDFEITDGTGDPASTTVPDGWTDLNTATFAYTNPTAVSEGEGIALKTTAAGGGNEGVRQTLTNLKASTTYVYRVRVRATAGDTCNLNVSDGTTTATDTSATTGVFETLEVQHTTTAAPAAVNVDLRSTLDTDICEWDHATVFERYATVSPPASQMCWDTDNTTATNYGGGAMVAVPGLSCTVTAPAGNWAVVVDANVSADNDDGGQRTLEVELREDCGGGAASVASNFAAMNNNAAANTQDNATVPIHFVHKLVSVGTTCVYTLQAASDGTNVFSNDQDGDSNSSLADPFSSLAVEMKPLQ